MLKYFIPFEWSGFSGKTSVGKRLAAKNGAIQWKTPPDSIKHLRHFFDETLHLRTAYYCLGNYVAAIEVLDLLKDRPVVMDRYFQRSYVYFLCLFTTFEDS